MTRPPETAATAAPANPGGLRSLRSRLRRRPGRRPRRGASSLQARTQPGPASAGGRFQSAMEDKALAAEQRTALIRVLVILLNVVTYWLWLEPGGLGIPPLAGALSVVASAYGVYVLLFRPAMRFPIMATSVWTTVTDGALITLWLHATGGFASPYYLLWYLSLVAVTFRYDWRAPLAAAGVYAVAYTGLVAAAAPLQAYGVEMAIRVSYILLCGGLGALLARETARAFDARWSLDERIRQAEAEEARIRAHDSESNAKASEAVNRLAAVVESSIDGILTKDLAGTITSWNQACEAMFGYSAPEAIGRSIAMLYPKGEAKEEARILARISAGKPVRIREAKRVRKDGSTLWVSVSASPLRAADGTVVGCASIKRDVTEARLAEKERLEAKARFVEFERLQELDRFKTQFINTAAHELRTPLLPLRMQLELMMTDEEHPPLPAQQEGLEVMRRNLERLAALVEDLLTVARSQAGRIQLDAARIDLGQLLHEAQQTFRTVAANRGVRLVVGPTEPFEAIADGKRVGQVLANLLSNAFKFTPPGGQVSVTLRPDRDGAIISVTDTGPGIAPKDQARLFQPFVQVHDTAQVTQPGSGLGLYICRQLVELHGGTIGCMSPGRGQGSTFWFTLPGIPFRPPPDAAPEWNPAP